MRDIVESTAAYEEWMERRADISGRLLDKKHRKMAEGPFPFLRATFYRWVEQWPNVCPRLAERDEDVCWQWGTCTSKISGCGGTREDSTSGG